MLFKITEDFVLEKDNFHDQTETVVVPEGVLKINRNAFSYCEHVKQVIIPDTVREIGNGAFHDSGITSIVIPDSIRIERLRGLPAAGARGDREGHNSDQRLYLPLLPVTGASGIAAGT